MRCRVLSLNTHDHRCVWPQIVGRLSKFLYFCTGGNGLTSRDAHSVYTNDQHRLDWVTTLSDAGVKPSTKAGFISAVIHMCDWIVDSTTAVAAYGGQSLTAEQERAVEKTRRAWARLRTREFKLAKRAGADNNRLEKMQARNQWVSVVAVMDMSTTIAVPRLRALLPRVAPRTLSAAERIEFFELLMFALVVTRPCRPCTFYSADLTDWVTAERDAAGNKVWIVTNIKTRDVYSHDALIVPSTLVAVVDAYVEHIRPAFVKQFQFRKRTPQQTDVQIQHNKGIMDQWHARRAASHCLLLFRMCRTVCRTIRAVRRTERTAIRALSGAAERDEEAVGREDQRHRLAEDRGDGGGRPSDA